MIDIAQIQSCYIEKGQVFSLEGGREVEA